MGEFHQLTVNELKVIVDKEIKKGNGFKYVYLSDDSEGNGYHGLYYHFSPIDVEDNEFDFYFNDGVGKKENSIILG